MSKYANRPEATMKRAEELLAVGQQTSALQILHESLGRINRNTAVEVLEPIVIRFIELCVSEKNSKFAKEGLSNFKNFAQNSDTESIENVVKKYISLVEAKLNEVQAKADKISETIEDLEALETPESLIMWTISGEEAKDRAEQLVAPYLKLAWETYRNILDILKNNTRLETIYQTVAVKTFQFCTEHKRKNEFRRLCEVLRHHLTNFSKYAHQQHSINLNEPESLQRQLSIRFGQLNTATELELWNEAFKTAEDIHSLLAASHTTPKATMMVNYYSKLTKVLLVSNNYLFHAAAQNKYYSTLKSSGAKVSMEQRQEISSQTLLSVLAVPVITTPKIRAGLLEVDDSKAKNLRLTSLLGLSRVPTRAGLLNELLADNILERVRPEIKELYYNLEAEFHPLSICKKLAPILANISSKPDEAKYVKALREVVFTRLLQQLSQVYTTIKIDSVVNLASLAPVFEYNSIEIERIIMNGCKRGELSIRIDHATRAITFQTDAFSSSNTKIAEGTQLQNTPSELVRTQLSSLAKRLNCAVNMIDPSILEAKQAAQAKAVQEALASAEEDHKAAINRRAIIDRRKEIAETLQIRKEKEEAREKALRLQKEQELEKQRLLEESKVREEERKRREIEEIQLEEAKKLADSIKSKLNIEVELKDLNTDKLMQIQVEHLEKEKNQMQAKLKALARTIDHMERGLRKEEIPLIEKDYQKQMVADKAYYEASIKLTKETARLKFEENMQFKSRMQKIQSSAEAYKSKILQARKELHSEEVEAKEFELEKAKQARIQEFHKLKEAERLAAEQTKAKAEAELAKKQQQEKEEQARKAQQEKEEIARKAQQEKDEAERKAKDEARKQLIAEAQAARQEKERLAALAATAAPEKKTGAYRPPGARSTGDSRPPQSATITSPPSSGGAWRRNDGSSSAPRSEKAWDPPSTDSSGRRKLNLLPKGASKSKDEPKK